MGQTRTDFDSDEAAIPDESAVDIETARGDGPAEQGQNVSRTGRRGGGRRRGDRRQFESRRDEIVDLAAALFAKNGYNGTGIREIGEAAQIARGALYYYIESKESLLNEIHNRVLDPLLTATRSIVESDASPREKICSISEVLLRQIIERHDHVWVFLHEYRSLTGERRETFRRKRGEFERALLMELSAGIADGEFQISDLRATMLAFLGMHNYTYQWVGRGADVDATSLSKLYCDIFFRGIEIRNKP